jgi:hypothetical protein
MQEQAELPRPAWQHGADPVAGDVILIANNGNRATPEDRYHFAVPYSSWHGSPSHRDSDIPLILSHRQHSAGELGALVSDVFAGRSNQRLIADLLLKLRQAPVAAAAGSAQSD